MMNRRTLLSSLIALAAAPFEKLAKSKQVLGSATPAPDELTAVSLANFRTGFADNFFTGDPLLMKLRDQKAVP